MLDLLKIATDARNKTSSTLVASIVSTFSSVQETANAFNNDFTQHFSDAPKWSVIFIAC